GDRAGRVPVLAEHRREHRVRAGAHRDAGEHHPGRQGRPSPRLHRGVRRRVRDRHRRARRDAVGRAAAATRHRPRAAHRPSHPGAGRLDVGHRQRDRGPDPEGHQQGTGGTDDPDDHAPPVPDQEGRPGPGGARRRSRGPGHASRAAGPQPPLPPDLREVRLMGFIMDGLAAEAYDREYSDVQLLRRIVAYFRPYAGAMLAAGLAVFMVASLDALLPIIVSVAIDRVGQEASDPGGVWRRTGGLVAAFLGAAVLSWCFNFVRQWLSARSVGDVVLRLRRDAFDAVMARDMSFYDEFSTGRVVSRVTSDTQDFSQVVT